MNARFRPFLGLAAALLLVPAALRAEQSDTGIGEEAASFLTWPVDARTASMAQAGVASTDDLNAPVLNPAGLSGVSGQQYGLNEDLLYQGTQLSNGSLAYGLFPGAALGAQFSYLDVGTVDKSVIQSGVIQPAGSFNPYYYTGGIGYGQSLLPWLSLGAEVKAVGENIDGYAASTAACDLGFQLKTLLRGFSMGASVQNLGGTLDGYELPLMGRLGVSYGTDFLDVRNSILVNADCQIPESAFGQTTVSAGLEVHYARFLSLRAGYQTGAQDGGITGVTGLTAGAGFGMNWWQVDYAWVPDGDLGAAQQLSFSAKF